MSNSDIDSNYLILSKSDCFSQQEEQLIQIKYKNKPKFQRRSISQYSTSTHESKNNPFCKYVSKKQLTKHDFQELDKLVINKMTLPCVFRHKLWPELAKQEQHDGNQDFFTFISTPSFLKYFAEHKILGLKCSVCCDTTRNQQATDDNTCTQCNNAVTVVMTNDLLVQDINRTFTQVQLFQENKPRFIDICELICCLLMKYNKYIQGVSLCCGLCLFYCSSKEDGYYLLEKIVASNIYQAFLDMNIELIKTYCDIIFKMVRSIMFSRAIWKQIFNKEIVISEKDFNESVYEIMSCSLAGIILSGFGKAGLEFGSNCIDYLCFCPQANINKRYIILCVAYYLMILSEIYGIDELVCAITNQIVRTQVEIAKFRGIVYVLNNNPQWLAPLFSSLEEILNYIAK